MAGPALAQGAGEAHSTIDGPNLHNPDAEANLAVAREIVDYIERVREQSDTGEESGIGADEVVLDITDLTEARGEQGLLGLAFHPVEPLAYVNYIDDGGDTVVAEVEVIGIDHSKRRVQLDCRCMVDGKKVLVFVLAGGEGVAYHDRDAGNKGGQYRSDDVDIWLSSSEGYYTGANGTGEWLEYTVDVADSGEYRLDLLVSAVADVLDRRHQGREAHAVRRPRAQQPRGGDRQVRPPRRRPDGLDPHEPGRSRPEPRRDPWVHEQQHDRNREQRATQIL